MANSAISTAKELKDTGTVVYTVGLFGKDEYTQSAADPNDITNRENAYLNAVSSNYPNATSYTSLGTGKNEGYYKTVTDTQNLTAIFQEISESIGYTSVTLDASSVTKDVMADGFKLSDGFTAANVTVQTDAYSGRDRDGNHVFANSPQT